MKQVTRYELDYHELDALIKKTYGHNFECVADQEWDNDSAHTFTYEKRPLVHEWDIKELEEFKETGKYGFSLSTLMQDMVNKEILPEGSYCIQVCW